jgi:hypothetical protein
VEEMSTELEVGARSFSLHSLPVVHTWVNSPAF